MNKLKAIWHTLKFMWIGRFGGKIDGGYYYLLKPIRVNKNAGIELNNLTIHKLHGGAVFIIEPCNTNEFVVSDMEITGKGGAFKA
tara:strand:+ start:52 stop:306 length:255 start_codon:yes stop_codon:yes gene_type:complete